MIKKIICFVFILLLFTLNVSAEETDVYKEQLEKSGALELEDALPQEVKEYLGDNGIDLNNYDWVNNLKTENVFSHILSFIKGGFKAPLIALGSIVAIILINSLLFTHGQDSINTVVLYAATLAIVGIIIAPIISAINTAVGAMKACATFMTAFVPVFAAITAMSGKAATSVSMSTMLLGAANGVSLLSNFAVVPLIGGYLSLSLATSVSNFINQGGVSSAVKKLSLWVMSLISTVFLGILSIQTVVNSAADNLSMRTAKFIIGSSVPVAGGVLSEALGTLTASVSLLKSSVGIYGVVICALIFLPILIELLLWRFTLWVADFVSQSFSLSRISGLLQSLDTVLSVLIGVILLTGAMFIISLSVVMGNGA
jgi:stage III sporulation protein AE